MSGSLFEQEEKEIEHARLPLAARMRPRTLEEFIGQTHLLGTGKLLRRLIDADRLGSVIFYGPPGCGKTTLARLLAGQGDKFYASLNAVTDGVAQLRKIIAEAQERIDRGLSKTVLFVDEIHRFNKSQQDALLSDVEHGTVDLVGATTSNPYFAVNSALLSRSQVFQFEALNELETESLINQALQDKQRGFGTQQISMDSEAIATLSNLAGGDARTALNTLEIAVLSSKQRPLKIDSALIRECMQRSAMVFDKDGDQHYDIASALIKSIRGSDADAGIYWLARLLESGEDLRFLCRRLVILASEDIGNADPAALSLAVACMQACEYIGLPEAQLTLSQTVAYLACAPKSNAATVAISEARKDVREQRVQPVPVHLRDSHYPGAKDLGNGKGYLYSHDEDDGISSQQYMSIPKFYYRPVNRGFELELQERLKMIRQKLNGEA